MTFFSGFRVEMAFSVKNGILFLNKRISISMTNTHRSKPCCLKVITLMFRPVFFVRNSMKKCGFQGSKRNSKRSSFVKRGVFQGFSKVEVPHVTRDFNENLDVSNACRGISRYVDVCQKKSLKNGKKYFEKIKNKFFRRKK